MDEPGLFYDIPIEKYHASKKAIGSSGIKEVLDCPALYFGQNLDPERPQEEKPDTTSQVFGNLAHCALFEPAVLNDRYRVGPDVHSKNLKVWQEFKKECESCGCIPIDSKQYKAAKKIRQSALLLPELKEALEHPGGRGETSAYWRDERTGVLCKCRPDWTMPVGDKACILWDGKTYATGNTEEFARQVPRMGYDIQNAWYADGFSQASGLLVLAFIFIVIGNEWPHPVNLCVLDEAAIASGARKYRRGLDTYAECVKTGNWPGYAPGIKTISLAPWALEEA
jgi:exodeoxyribonuclease VIII